MPALPSDVQVLCANGRNRAGAGITQAAKRKRRTHRAPRPSSALRPVERGIHVHHQPVLAAELLGACAPEPGMVVVDCTFGGGGHAALLAEQLGPEGCLIAIDRDPTAEQRFMALAEQLTCRMRFIRASYAEALAQLAEEGLRADVIYFDLGISSMQLEHAERGFAYSYDAPLDMRMDPEQSLSAEQIINDYPEDELAAILREFGEERHARAIARAICVRRQAAPLRSTQELVSTITAALPAPARFGSGHPAKRSFQALRIAVNEELAELDSALPAAWQLLTIGGVLAAISFHSLEDRRVKRFLVRRARGCICPPEFPVCCCGRSPEAELISRRAITAASPELADNPRAASARLRAARKLREADQDAFAGQAQAPAGSGTRPARKAQR